jgi:hypothetical protein
MASSSKSSLDKIGLQLEIHRAKACRRDAVDKRYSAQQDIASMTSFMKHMDTLPDNEVVLNSKIAAQKVMLNGYDLIEGCTNLIKIIDHRVDLMQKMVSNMNNDMERR